MDDIYQRLEIQMKTYLSNEDIKLVNKAYLFAKEKHQGQIRKSGEEYIIHPVSVAKILTEQKLSVKVIIASLLHDVVEDTCVELEEIRGGFGEDVAQIVDGVTKLGTFEGMTIDQVKAENQRKLILATTKDIRVILVKLADRLHNMSTIKFMNEEKQKVIALETLEVYAPLAHRLGMYRIKWELEDLSFKVINKNAYDEIAPSLNMKRSERKEFIDKMIIKTIQIFDEIDINIEVKGRPKHIYSIYKKMHNKNKDFDELTDLFAFRIIVNSIPECYSALGTIHENFKPLPMRFKDYIPTPKHNMYQSIHTTVINEEGQIIEFQIRTHEMDIAAEYGVAAHWMYKSDNENKEIQNKIYLQLDWLEKIKDNKNSYDSIDFMKVMKNDYLSKTIMVYTPKGDVIEIPEKATVLDFAYYVHTNIGNKALSGKVNGKLVSLGYKLNIGDMVQVITSDIVEPSVSNLQKVFTSRAKDSIKKYFKGTEKQNIQKEGNKLLIKYALSRGIDNIEELLKESKIDNILIKFNSKSRENFFYEVGNGSINVSDVVLYIKHTDVLLIDNKNEVLINKEDNTYSLNYCKYCSPIYGDEITSCAININPYEHEYMIHRVGCVKCLANKKIAKWNHINSIFICRLELEIIDEKNSILNTITAISENDINIISIQLQTKKEKVVNGEISFEVHNLEEYNKVAKSLNASNSVVDFERIMESR